MAMARACRGTAVVAAVAGITWVPQPQAVAWAAGEAGRRRVPLRLLHGFATLPYQSGSGHELLRTAAQAELDDAVALARRERPGLEVLGQLVPERADLALHQESATAALVVIGTKSHDADIAEDRYGSVAGTLLVEAACPVVAVPPSDRLPGRPRAVVVAVDGSEVSQEAVAFAFDAASRRSAPLAIVHYWPAGPTAAARSAARLDHRLLLAEYLAGFAERYPDVRVVDDGCEGDPSDELVRRSRLAALLVLGTHGRDRWATAVWGSVSRALVRESACPVAVVRPANGTRR